MALGASLVSNTGIEWALWIASMKHKLFVGKVDLRKIYCSNALQTFNTEWKLICSVGAEIILIATWASTLLLSKTCLEQDISKWYVKKMWVAKYIPPGVFVCRVAELDGILGTVKESLRALEEHKFANFCAKNVFFYNWMKTGICWL